MGERTPGWSELSRSSASDATAEMASRSARGPPALRAVSARDARAERDIREVAAVTVGEDVGTASVVAPRNAVDGNAETWSRSSRLSNTPAKTAWWPSSKHGLYYLCAT
jgi:hypothetical protein